MELAEYYTEFMQNLHARSGAEQNFTEAVFTEYLCDFLIEQAAVDNYTYIGYRNTARGLRADAWDYNEETGLLNLFITDFKFGDTAESLTNTDITRGLKRLEKFFLECLSPAFLKGLEESSPAYGAARFIYEKSKINAVSRVQFFLLTNGQLSKRVGSIENIGAEGYDCTFDIWDIARLFRLETSGRAREDVVIDFTEILPEGLPCLPAFTGSDSFESYLLVMPGKVVADLYDKYGERLLEQNVRTFLQFRGNVNKGLRNTIQNEPQMFFAYNNGLTATAENIKTDTPCTRIQSVTNLQIVNGGQTTASIFTAGKKNRAELSKVYVQVKLTVIAPEQVEDVVPRISEYANTQNKVNAADFFSNHPFHLRMEEMSRRIWAPSPHGSFRETHWYYERARGQYANAQAVLTPAQKKEFLARNPRSQMFTKTDLAKFENSLNMQPHVVSLGAQKNFARFANDTGKLWQKNEKQFNELYFKNLIAKALLFRFLDKSIMKQSWYGGYKANIITYSLAKFSQMVAETGKCLNLTGIWQQQQLSPAVEKQLLGIAARVNEHIQKTPDGITNVTEWCKKELCWQNLQKVPIPLHKGVVRELSDPSEVQDEVRDAQKTQKIDSGIQAQEYVLEKGAAYWKKALEYGMKEMCLSPNEKSIFETACKIPFKLPSSKQSEVLLKAEQKLMDEGFFP